MNLNFFKKRNLARQILGGYVVIISVAVACSLFCISTLKINQDIDTEISEVNLPLVLSLKDFKTMANEMSVLSNNWVYKPNEGDKKRLLTLINSDAPALNTKISAILNLSDDKRDDSLSTAFTMLKTLTDNQLKITQLLTDDSLYSNDVVVDEAIKILESNIEPSAIALNKLLTRLIELQDQKMKEAQVAKKSSYSILTYLFIFLIVASLVTAYFSYNNMKMNVVEPIKNIRDVLSDMGKGKVMQMKDNERQDELGEMYSAMVTLTAGISAQSAFANQIGLGKYDEAFELQSEEDVMGSALLAMRTNLKKATEEDKKRSWATEGLAKFVDILRSNNTQTANLSESILTNLVKYLKANQGTMFVVNDDNEKDVHLELVACYAYDRKKHVEKRIEIGEGLVGQAYLEKDIIFLTDVPENYVTITSGLGDATPRAVMIVPLKMNEKVYGILEIASFTAFEKYMIEFTEKLGESIASTIAATKINDRTSSLLAQTQIQAEEMRAQEEEMRQNMEELQATQEEMGRKENDYIKQIESLKAELESLKA